MNAIVFVQHLKCLLIKSKLYCPALVGNRMEFKGEYRCGKYDKKLESGTEFYHITKFTFNGDLPGSEVFFYRCEECLKDGGENTEGNKIEVPVFMLELE